MAKLVSALGTSYIDVKLENSILIYGACSAHAKEVSFMLPKGVYMYIILNART